MIKMGKQSSFFLGVACLLVSQACATDSYSLSSFFNPVFGEPWVFRQTDSLPGDSAGEVTIERIAEDRISWGDAAFRNIYELNENGLSSVDFTASNGTEYDVTPDRVVFLPTSLGDGQLHTYSGSFIYHFHWGMDSPYFSSSANVSVSGFETVTVPSGTFTALKVIEQGHGEWIDFSGEAQEQDTVVTYWLVEGVGMVKHQTEIDGSLSLVLERTGAIVPAEISVSYNGTNIADGDTSPSASDGTDFDNVDTAIGNLIRTFRVSNTGGSTLTLGTATSSSTEFTVSGLNSSVAAGGYEDFTIVFDPSSIGTKTATISFPTNDSDENPFNFSVTGESTATSTGLAPSVETMIARLPGQVIFDVSFTSATRFSWNGMLGNWSYEWIGASVGKLTQTYDKDGNNPDIYREETILTFSSASTGSFLYREYNNNLKTFEISGAFDFPWLAVSGPPVWEPQGWVYVTWPYAYATADGTWRFFAASGNQLRVDLSTGIWGPFNQSSGWQYFSWPYIYSINDSTWYWHNAGATQWVVDLATGLWTLLGE
jgi:hypothetical protein